MAISPAEFFGSHWFKYTSISLGLLALSIWNATVKANGDLHLFWLVIVSSKVYHLVLFNAALSAILLFGKVIQVVFFGPLLPSERENSRRRVTKYIVFKIIFVLVVLEPDVRSRVVALWAVWFSVLGFLNGFAGLAKDRFQNIVTLTPNARPSLHAKMIFFLFGILFLNLLWFGLCIPLFWKREEGISLLLLLTFECFVIFVDTMQTLIKYMIHLYDTAHSGTWDRRTNLVYFTDFIAESLVIVATLFHYVHILIVNGFSLSLSDVFIGFHVYLYMRASWHTLISKIVAYNAYRRLDEEIDTRFERVHKDELAEKECAICFETMDEPAARKLPCSHIFHSSCLRQWLQTQSTCPICRRSLIPGDSSKPQPSHSHSHAPLPHLDNPLDGVDRHINRNDDHNHENNATVIGNHSNDNNANIGNNNGQPRGQGNNENTNVYRFNSNSAWSWLPSISLQVTTQNPRPTTVRQENLEQHVNNVSEMFPGLSRLAIARALLATGSVEATIELALSGQIAQALNDSRPTERFRGVVTSANAGVANEILHRRSPSVDNLLRLSNRNSSNPSLLNSSNSPTSPLSSHTLPVTNRSTSDAAIISEGSGLNEADNSSSEISDRSKLLSARKEELREKARQKFRELQSKGKEKERDL